MKHSLPASSPKRPFPIAKKWIASIVTLAAIACVGISIVVFPGLGNAVALTTRPGPNVHLSSPVQSGDDIPIAWDMALSATANDDQGVTRIELWMDGVLLNSEPNQSGSQRSFRSVFTWRPPSPGIHSIFARAYNSAGDVGQSNVFQYNVRVPEAGEILASLAIEAQPGDTVDSIASEAGVSTDVVLEANPQLPSNQSLNGGEVVIVPSDVWPAGVDATQFNDVMQTDASLQAGLPAGPAELSVEELECGRLRLHWKPGGEGIQGYRIYQLSPGSEGMVFAGEEKAAASQFDVTAPIEGLWEFYVAAVDSRGQENLAQVKWSVPDCDIIEQYGDDPSSVTGAQDSPTNNAVFEIIRLRVKDPSIAKLYCYVRAGGGAGLFNRVPANDGEFISRGVNGQFPIQKYFEPLAVKGAPAGGAIGVDMECWGWSGNALSVVGVIAKNNDMSLWDGSEIPFRSASGSLEGSYTIQGNPQEMTFVEGVTGAAGSSLQSLSPPVIQQMYSYAPADTLFRQVAFASGSDYVIYKFCGLYNYERTWLDALYKMEPRFLGQVSIGVTNLCADAPRPAGEDMYACYNKDGGGKTILTSGMNGGVLPEFADAKCIRVTGKDKFEWVRCGDLQSPISADVAVCSQPIGYTEDTLPVYNPIDQQLTKVSNLRWGPNMLECAQKLRYLSPFTCLRESKRILLWDWSENSTPEERAAFKGFRIYRRPVKVCGDYLPEGSTSEQLSSDAWITYGTEELVGEIYGGSPEGTEGFLLPEYLGKFGQWEYSAQVIVGNSSAYTKWLTGSAPEECEAQLQVELTGFTVSGYDGGDDEWFELDSIAFYAGSSSPSLFKHQDGYVMPKFKSGEKISLNKGHPIWPTIPPIKVALTPNYTGLSITVNLTDHDSTDWYDCILGCSFDTDQDHDICSVSYLYDRAYITSRLLDSQALRIEEGSLDGVGHEQAGTTCKVYVRIISLKP